MADNQKGKPSKNSEDSPILISSESDKSSSDADVDVEGIDPEHFVKQEPSDEMKYIKKVAKQVEESQGSDELFSPEEHEPATQHESQYQPTPAMDYVKKIAKQVEKSVTPEHEHERGNRSQKTEATTTKSKGTSEKTTAEAEHEESPCSTPTISPTASEMEELSRYNAEQAVEEEDPAYFVHEEPDYDSNGG